VFEQLRPIAARYQTLPIRDGFNWEDCLRDSPTGYWYVVAFRSIRKTTADGPKLWRYDRLAYEEALDAGGLLAYFRGDLDGRRRCLSLCIWDTQTHARDAATLPAHRSAAALYREMYVSYEVERYVLQRGSELGTIRLEPLAR
jgi:hypothetical protein